MLEIECRNAGVRLFLNTSVQEVSKTTDFVVRAGELEFRAPVLVIATGGLSIPKTRCDAASDNDLARQFGLAIHEPRPALVPFVFNAEDRSRYCDLAGVSADVAVSIGSQQFREKMLITHRGLSGPAILQISSYWEPAQPVAIDLAPGCDVTAALREPNAPRNVTTLKNALHKSLPNRFSNRWLDLYPPAAWTTSGLAELEHSVHQWTLFPAGTEGFAKAEVTEGGVDTNELSAKTMESRRVSGLFFVGEVVDVTGHLGGFNFQWAWASGACAGRAL